MKHPIDLTSNKDHLVMEDQTAEARAVIQAYVKESNWLGSYDEQEEYSHRLNKARDYDWFQSAEHDDLEGEQWDERVLFNQVSATRKIDGYSRSNAKRLNKCFIDASTKFIKREQAHIGQSFKHIEVKKDKITKEKEFNVLSDLIGEALVDHPNRGSILQVLSEPLQDRPENFVENNSQGVIAFSEHYSPNDRKSSEPSKRIPSLFPILLENLKFRVYNLRHWRSTGTRKNGSLGYSLHPAKYRDHVKRCSKARRYHDLNVLDDYGRVKGAKRKGAKIKVDQLKMLETKLQGELSVFEKRKLRNLKKRTKRK